MLEATPADFESGRFHLLYERLSDQMGENKYKKFDPDKYAGVVAGYLDI